MSLTRDTLIASLFSFVSLSSLSLVSFELIHSVSCRPVQLKADMLTPREWAAEMRDMSREAPAAAGRPVGSEFAVESTFSLFLLLQLFSAHTKLSTIIGFTFQWLLSRPVTLSVPLSSLSHYLHWLRMKSVWEVGGYCTGIAECGTRTSQLLATRTKRLRSPASRDSRKRETQKSAR